VEVSMKQVPLNQRNKPQFTGSTSFLQHNHDNLFTMTLYRCIQHLSQLQEQVRVFLSAASRAYVAADALKDWFEVQVDTWMTSPAARQQTHAAISVLCQHLVQNTYSVIAWEHVARGFRSGY
jgi:hypothetical protein